MHDVYITDLAGFLPNDPVHNDDMERVLGMINGRPSRARRLVLRNNGIRTRHYAIDPASGRYTHNNAQMAAEAVRRLLARSGLGPADIDCLACGTASPDQIKPAHAHMVHGELGGPPCEVVSTAGVCTSGITALKYAWMNVALGQARRAVAAGSEFASSFMRARNFEPEIEARVKELERRPELAFEKDFLRWMLSDGAGAALLGPQPNADRPSLRIDWIEGLSFAGEMPACMYSGAVRDGDGRLKGWREAEEPQTLLREGYFAVKQDARLLNEHILPLSARALVAIARRRGLQAADIAWFLPHYSSEYFRLPLARTLAEHGFDFPLVRWYSNLATKGNVGSAAIYLIMEELLHSGRLQRGERLLCYIPESARFCIYYMHLTVV